MIKGLEAVLAAAVLMSTSACKPDVVDPGGGGTDSSCTVSACAVTVCSTTTCNTTVHDCGGCSTFFCGDPACATVVTCSTIVTSCSTVVTCATTVTTSTTTTTT
jgi:hypothetical protein